MQWDFWTLSPESAHQVTILMSDRGTPTTWRNMHGYGSHTFMWVNAGGEKFWVKYHFKTDQGIENFTDAEAKAMAAEEPDYPPARPAAMPSTHGRAAVVDRVEIQIMPFAEADDYRFNPFDLTKVWPHADYPPITIGRMVLDRNPDELLRRDRAGRVRAVQHGARGSGRARTRCCSAGCSAIPTPTATASAPTTCSCRSTSRSCRVHSYNKDGADALPPRRRSAGLRARTASAGRKPTRAYAEDAVLAGGRGEMVRSAYALHAEDDDTGQAGTLWQKVRSTTATATTSCANIVDPCRRPTTLHRGDAWIASWPTGTAVTPELGRRVGRRPRALRRPWHRGTAR